MAAPPDDDPAQFAALTALFRQGRFAEVVEEGERLAIRHPRSGLLFQLLGTAQSRLGRSEAAIASLEKALAIAPDDAEARNNLGILLAGQGRDAEAIACFSRAATLAPRHADVRNNLGILLGRTGRPAEALEAFEQAIRLRPSHAQTHFNLGNLLKDCGRMEDAAQAFRQAIACAPGHSAAYNNLGHLLSGLGRSPEAVGLLSRAVAIKPDFVEAHNNLGVALGQLGRHDEAAAHFRAALRLQPGYAEASYNLGSLLGNLGRPEEAIACFMRALEIRPIYARARAQKLHQLAVICDWDGLAADAAAIPELGITGEAVTPFLMLALEDEPARHLIRARRYARDYLPPMDGVSFAAPGTRPERLRIGYFSADFHEHATLHLMARLFELHDRTRFRLHAFSYGPDTGDAMRARVKAAFDVFHDVRGLSDREIAELARKDGIDIAVDLKGETKDTRWALFAHRPAPVQISYLGYPGTSGAPFMDYLVADRTVIPEEERQHYSEKLILLPHTYQANDDTHAIAAKVPSRADLGLPDQGFVFCCFNNSYKISPLEFDVWMRLLERIEGSVLWLLKANPRAESNLRKEAQKRRIDPDRLVFAERVEPFLHLARHAQADLFLDTFRYNAHTTASDALWAGVPLMTLAGKGFPARVAASLLKACDLGELIADDVGSYERLAGELAADPGRLAASRAKLRQMRRTAPLFSSEDIARALERGFDEAFRRHIEGDEAGDIVVRER